MKKLRTHLTYANVMASLAVFLVLGGAGAWAAKSQTQKIGSTQIKASAITTAKIKNAAVGNSKLQDGSVSTAKLADGSVAAAKLADGAVGNSKLANDSVTGDKVSEVSLGEVPSATSANPFTFAHVNSNGVVDAANSKGVTSLNVSKPSTGIYCISVPSFAPRGAQVTPQVGGATSAQVGSGGSCPPSAFQVSTLTAAGTAIDSGFYVELYR